MKIRPGEAKIFPFGRTQTDTTKPLTVAFRNFANSSDPAMKLQICHIIGQRQAEILRYATPKIRAGHEENIAKPLLSSRSCASTRSSYMQMGLHI